MSDLVTEDDLERARNDPEFRQQLLAHNLERLLEALNDMRNVPDNNDSPDARPPDPGRRRSRGQARRPAATRQLRRRPAGCLGRGPGDLPVRLPFRQNSL